MPFDSVQTVDDLRQLVEYADSHKQVEAALLELFKFRVSADAAWLVYAVRLASVAGCDSSAPLSNGH